MAWSSAPATTHSWFRQLFPGKLSSHSEIVFREANPCGNLCRFRCAKNTSSALVNAHPACPEEEQPFAPLPAGEGMGCWPGNTRSQAARLHQQACAPSGLTRRPRRTRTHAHLKRRPTSHEIDARQPHASMTPQLSSNHARHDGYRYRPPPASRWFRRAGRRHDGRQSPSKRRQSRACPLGCAGTRWGHAHWNAGRARR